jgi:4-amino-4-deoxychorismate lyase
MTVTAAVPLVMLIDPVAVTDAAAATAAAGSTDFSGTFHIWDATRPALLVSDLSAQRGDGIFETMAVVNGRAQAVEAHLARLESSARLCELPAPNLPQWRAAIAAALSLLPGQGEIALKIVLSRGLDGNLAAEPTPTAWLQASVSADFSAARSEGITVVTLDRGYPHDAADQAPWLLLGAKTLSYAVNMAALREAKRRGAADAIFVSRDDVVMEGPTSNVIIRSEGVYLTPVPSGGILHGTTQQSVFSHLEELGERTAYRDFSSAELLTADAAWLVSSVRLAAPVVAINGQPFPADLPLTRSLNAFLLARTQ